MSTGVAASIVGAAVAIIARSAPLRFSDLIDI